MIYKSTVAAHSMTVDNKASIQMQTVMMNVAGVQRCHALFELALGHHFANIFEYISSFLNLLLCVNAPSFVCCHESLNAWRNMMPLNASILTCVAARTCFWLTFGVHQAIQAILATICVGFTTAYRQIGRWIWSNVEINIRSNLFEIPTVNNVSAGQFVVDVRMPQIPRQLKIDDRLTEVFFAVCRRWQ